MKKSIIAVVLFALLFAVAACTPAQQTTAPQQEATATPEPQPQEAAPSPAEPVETPAPTAVAETPVASEAPENESDLVLLLKMTRADIEAKYGAGKSVVYDSYGAYDDNGEAIEGFPVEYEKLPNVWIFFDADEPSESAEPYMPKEKAGDKVIGVKLGQNSEPYNVKGYVAAIAQADYEKYKKEVVLVDKTHYYLDVKLGTLRYVWLSEKKEMSDSWLYVCEK